MKHFFPLCLALLTAPNASFSQAVAPDCLAEITTHYVDHRPEVGYDAEVTYSNGYQQSWRIEPDDPVYFSPETIAYRQLEMDNIIAATCTDVVEDGVSLRKLFFDITFEAGVSPLFPNGYGTRIEFFVNAQSKDWVKQTVENYRDYPGEAPVLTTFARKN